MAGEKTQIEIDAQIDAGIRVNGNKEITPPIHNAIEKAITNSYLNKKDGGLSVEQITGYSTEVALSDRKAFAYVGYVDDEILAAIAAIDLSIFYQLDGSTPLTGNMDADGNDINDVDILRVLTSIHLDGVEAIKFNNANGSLKFGATPFDPAVIMESTAIGDDVLYSATVTSTRNTGLGKGVFGALEDGQDNIGMGVNVGVGIILGSRNFIAGSDSAALYDSSDCFLLGRNIGNIPGISVFNEAIGIGNGAGIRASNQAVFGGLDTKIYEVYLGGTGLSDFTTAPLDVLWTLGYYPPNNANENVDADLIIGVVPARGTGTPGDLVYKYAIPAASGTTRQSLGLSAKMVGETGDWEFEKDIELTDDSKGIIMTDRNDATRYRIYIDSGSIQIEAA